MENKSMITPDELVKIAGTQPETIKNQSLKDINEVLKTVDGILGKFGTSLQDIVKKNQTKGMGDKKELSKVPQTEQINQNPTRIMSAPKLQINSKEASDDLKKRLESLKEESTIKDLKKQIKKLEVFGLSKVVENWIKQFVEVKQ